MIIGFSTMTQKGQIAVPKVIRDYFNLQPSDKIRFEIKNNAIVLFRVPDIREMRGIAHTVRFLTKKDEKAIVEKAVLEKFRKKQIPQVA
jgi:AbrB family looped-hinge helix DNA binding protein